MIGLDTNVLVRYVLRDDENQFKLASQLIQQSIKQNQIIVIHLLVIQETEWVLRSVAKRNKAEIIYLFKSLLETAKVLIESEDILEQALLSFENSNAGFSDCLMIAQYRHMGCNHMATFDRNAAKVEGTLLLG